MAKEKIVGYREVFGKQRDICETQDKPEASLVNADPQRKGSFDTKFNFANRAGSENASNPKNESRVIEKTRELVMEK